MASRRVTFLPPLLEQAESNAHVKGAEFSRNFGKEAAIFAGLSISSGDAVIVMDCDLQDRPEFIKDLYEKAQEGILSGSRTNTIKCT